VTAPDIPALLHALERELSSGAFDCVDWCEPTDDVPCRSCRVKMLSDAAIAALTAEVARLTLSDLASREWVERFKVYVTRTDATIAALTVERDDARETLTVHCRE